MKNHEHRWQSEELADQNNDFIANEKQSSLSKHIRTSWISMLNKAILFGSAGWLSTLIGWPCFGTISSWSAVISSSGSSEWTAWVVGEFMEFMEAGAKIDYTNENLPPFVEAYPSKRAHT